MLSITVASLSDTYWSINYADAKKTLEKMTMYLYKNVLSEDEDESVTKF